MMLQSLIATPINNWPKTYSCIDSALPLTGTITLNKDGTFKDKGDYGWSDTGKYTYDGNNSWYFNYNNSNDLYASGNYEKIVQDTGLTQNGTPTNVVCYLNK